MSIAPKYPGSSISKTFAYIFLIGILWYTIDRSPLENEPLRIAFDVLALCGVLLGMLSIAKVVTISIYISNIEDIKETNIHTIVFQPKYILLISSFLFFILLILAVFIFGGILKSPYTSLLTITTLFVLIQSTSEGEMDDYISFFDAYGIKFDENKYYSVNKVSSISTSILFIFITLAVLAGEYLLHSLGFYQDFVKGHNIEGDDYWFKTIGYICFSMAYFFVFYILFNEKINRFIGNCIQSVIKTLHSKWIMALVFILVVILISWHHRFYDFHF